MLWDKGHGLESRGWETRQSVCVRCGMGWSVWCREEVVAMYQRLPQNNSHPQAKLQLRRGTPKQPTSSPSQNALHKTLFHIHVDELSAQEPPPRPLLSYLPAWAPVAGCWAAVVATAQLPVAHLLTRGTAAVTAAAPAAECIYRSVIPTQHSTAQQAQHMQGKTSN